MNKNRKTKSELISELAKLKRKVKKLRMPKIRPASGVSGVARGDVLREMIDVLPDAIYVKDASCKKIIANLADLRNMGCQSESEVVGKDDFAFFPRAEAEKFFADDQSVIKNGQPVINREESFVDRQGVQHWLLTSKLPLWDDNGKVTGIVGISRDITSRKQAERDLLLQKIEFEQLFENIAFAIVLCDETEKVIKVNHRFEKMFQYTAEEIKGEYINKAIIPDNLINEGTEVSLKLSHNEIVIKETFRKRKDGSLVNVRIHGVPIIVEGKQTGIYGIYEDISGRKQAGKE